MRNKEAEIFIRTASKSDLAILENLCKTTFLEAYSYNPADENVQLYFAENFEKDILSRELEDPKISFLIGTFEGKDVGYAKINRDKKLNGISDKQVLSIEKIYLLQEFIGKKIGLSLLNHTLEIASKENFKKIWLIVWQDNVKAIKFYRKSGFKITGFHEFRMGKEIYQDLLMQKEI